METMTLLGLLVALMALAVVVGLAMLLLPHAPGSSRRSRPDGPDDPAGSPVPASPWPGLRYAPSPGELEEAGEVAQLYPDDLPPDAPSDMDTLASSDDPELLRQSLLNVLFIGMQVVDRQGRAMTVDDIDRFAEQMRKGSAVLPAGKEGESAVPASPPSPPAAQAGKEKPAGKYAASMDRLASLRASMADVSDTEEIK